MKQIYMSVLLVMLFTVNVFGEQHASKFGEKEKVAVVYENNVFLKAEPRNSVDVLVDREENVSPIVPAGASLDEMLIV